MKFPVQPGPGASGASPSPGDPAAVPTVPAKPLRVGKWSALGAVLLVVLYLGYSLMRTVKTGAVPDGEQKVQQRQLDNGKLGKVDVTGFNQLTSRNVDALLRKKILMQTEAQSAGLTPEQLTAIIATMPPCNADERRTMRGQNMMLVNAQLQQRVQLNCGTDDAWHALPKEAADIPPVTPEQQAAMDRQRGVRRSGGASAPTRQERLNAALASTSVVEFATVATPPLAPAPGASISGPLPALDTAAVQTAAKDQKKGYPWDTFTGPLYHVFGGVRFIEGILTNRLQGEFTGPVIVMVTTAVYSLDRQHVLIPQGTLIAGTSSKVSQSGQRRLSVAFDRMIFPDGYTVDIKSFVGLDQQGAAGLTGRVNTHWPKIIGTAALIGAIGGLSQIGNVSSSGSGWTNVRVGIGSTTGEEATQILQQTYNTLPTVTVYEGTRVNVWVLQDLTLPAVENHTVSPTL